MAGHSHARLSTCAFCDAELDRLLAPVRVVAGELFSVCERCARGDVPAHILGGERGEEAPCDDPRESDPDPAGARRWPARPSVMIGACAGVILLAVVAARVGSSAVSPAAVPSPTDPDVALHASQPAAQASAVAPETSGDDELTDEELEQAFFEGELLDESGELPPTIEDMREQGDMPIEEFLPILADWVFPVSGSTEQFPVKVSRQFGAKRTGERPSWCGKGHCGVDLDGSIGTPIVAVAWGEVYRIVHATDGRSGKYVTLKHPDFVYTSYMHLHSIADGIKVGDEIQQGDVIGTLGRTGILLSKEHLHFQLRVPQSGKLRHIEPTPFLLRARR